MALIVIVLFATSAANAETTADSAEVKPIRPVSSTYYVGMGSASLVDTYLTPLKYSGWGAELGYYRRQAMGFNPQSWVMQLDLGLNLNSAQNPAKNAKMYDLDLRGAWSMIHRWQLPFTSGLWAGVGGITELNLGALYLARNGNNPVAAKADWTIGATTYASYSFKAWRLPITARYQVAVPLVGAFFSPDYGELYYEIYLGNHNGLAHFAWPGNFRRLDQRLTADLHLGATTLTVGYHGTLFSSKVNHIVSRRFTHMLTLGITCEWISLAYAKRPSPTAQIISANY